MNENKLCVKRKKSETDKNQLERNKKLVKIRWAFY